MDEHEDATKQSTWPERADLKTPDGQAYVIEPGDRIDRDDNGRWFVKSAAGEPRYPYGWTE